MRKLTAGYLNELMRIAAEKQIQPRPYEHAGKRRARCNGTRPRCCDLTPKGRVEMVSALTDLIKHDEDRIMIIDLGPIEGSVEKRIEFPWCASC